MSKALSTGYDHSRMSVSFSLTPCSTALPGGSGADFLLRAHTLPPLQLPHLQVVRKKKKNQGAGEDYNVLLHYFTWTRYKVNNGV